MVRQKAVDTTNNPERDNIIHHDAPETVRFHTTEQPHPLLIEYEESFLIRQLIDNVPDYLFIKDTESRFVIVNDAIATDLGLRPDDLVGKSDFDIHSKDAANEYFRVEQEIIRTGNPLIDFEEPASTTKGLKKWLLSSKVPLRSRTGDIIGLVGVSRDITARKQAEAEALFLAHHDPLTRLPNRSLLMERIEQAILGAAQDKRCIALAFLDLDNFKFINDNLGHAVGDEVLKAAATRIGATIGSKDTAVRLGGDEFVILLADQPLDGDLIVKKLERLRIALGKTMDLGTHAAKVTTSIGCAIFPNDAREATSLLKNADIAMYFAKSSGRNNLKLYEVQMREEFLRRGGAHKTGER
ncbi:GGDEF domain-containing protein [Shinella oryzae]|uniref:GGDEF domain-containing protein n=1 Tax=Shinella oryzae TaxID=2871820 RepID=A0ABY9KB63_9HYPH|nr:GGDEF domain-containing protein [Shinella oryzae]WLS05343.1 GGDEF domain-containing protein [Shinella oryzae]